MTQNVVTYTVEIVTDNPAGRLLPYLTANVKFEVNRRENVLRVPNAALRWTPSVEQVAPEFRRGPARPARRGPPSPAETRPAATGSGAAGKMRPGMVYAVQDQYVRPIPVRAGLSDGAYTEVQGEGLVEGLELVTGVEAVSAGAAESRNPFLPKLPRPPRGGPPPP
jgi:HlyD family secretion protein